jgi:hypothetical protein
MMDRPMSETPTVAKAPSKRTIVEAIVLAFSKSDVREVVGTDALKTVLDARYVEMVRTPGLLQLQPVYDLLASQPGFRPELAAAPFCRVKLWEHRLRIPVELPRELSGLTSLDLDRQAQRCRVPDEDLARLLHQDGAPAARPREQAAAGAPHVAPTPGASAGPSPRRRVIAYLLFALGMLGAGGSTWWALAGGRVETLSPAQISTDIGLKAVRRSGSTIGAVLADTSAWMSHAPAERQRLLMHAFENVQAIGAARLVLMDDQGHVFGHAHMGDDGKPAATVQ